MNKWIMMNDDMNKYDKWDDEWMMNMRWMNDQWLMIWMND